MSLEVTHASLNDLDALTELEALCFSPAEAADRDAFAARLTAFPEHFWLLRDGARVLSMVNGLVTNERDLTDRMYAEPAMHRPLGAWQMIFGVATHPDFRGRGYAGLLLQRAAADARTAGRFGVVLTCREEKRGFYERFGFRDEGPSRSVHGGGVWYQMRLSFTRPLRTGEPGNLTVRRAPGASAACRGDSADPAGR